MIDMKDLRRMVETARAGGRAVLASPDWLTQVERELAAGNAARAELARRDGVAQVIESIEAGVSGSAR
jgi:hypothetical protein